MVDDFHAIKGLLANLGLKEEAQKAGELQDLCDSNDFEKVRPKKKVFLKDMTAFLNELRKDLNS